MNSNRLVRIAALCGALLGFSTTNTWASCSDRPGTPNNLVAQNPASGQISLNWHPTGGEKCYDIEVSKNGTVVGQSITGGNCGKSSIVFNDLGYGQNYCFRVRARTEAGTQGCISAQPSNSACSGTGVPPLIKPGQQVVLPSNDPMMVGTDLMGNDYNRTLLDDNNAASCQSICDKDAKCLAWSWVKPNSGQGPKAVCYVKSAIPNQTKNPNVTSGVKEKPMIVK